MAILYTIGVILLVIGIISFIVPALVGVIGWLLHALIVVAIVLFIIGFLRGRTTA